jgi:SHS2 domain-containing protein
MASKHTYLSHTADIAFDVEADSLEELFTESFQGWLNSVAEQKDFTADGKIELNLKAESLEQLLVDFLNEVNFLLTVKKVLCIAVEKIDIDKQKFSLFAVMKTKNVDDISILKEEIKSVTYHQMEIRIQGGKYFVRVVFDI